MYKIKHPTTVMFLPYIVKNACLPFFAWILKLNVHFCPFCIFVFFCMTFEIKRAFSAFFAFLPFFLHFNLFLHSCLFLHEFWNRTCRKKAGRVYYLLVSQCLLHRNEVYIFNVNELCDSWSINEKMNYDIHLFIH